MITGCMWFKGGGALLHPTKLPNSTGSIQWISLKAQKGRQHSDPFKKTSPSSVVPIDNWCGCLLFINHAVSTGRVRRPPSQGRVRPSPVVVMIMGFWEGIESFVVHTSSYLRNKEDKFLVGFVAMGFKPQLFPVDWWVITGEEGKGKGREGKGSIKYTKGLSADIINWVVVSCGVTSDPRS